MQYPLKSITTHGWTDQRVSFHIQIFRSDLRTCMRAVIDTSYMPPSLPVSIVFDTSSSQMYVFECLFLVIIIIKHIYTARFRPKVKIFVIVCAANSESFIFCAAKSGNAQLCAANVKQLRLIDLNFRANLVAAKAQKCGIPPELRQILTRSANCAKANISPN